MIGLAFFLAAVGTAPGTSGDATGLTCNLSSTDGSHFQMFGHFDADGLHSNLSALIKVEGAFSGGTSAGIVTTDGTQRHSWTLNRDNQIFDASLTEYGSKTGLLVLERREQVSYHQIRKLVGVGLCNLRGDKVDRKSS